MNRHPGGRVHPGAWWLWALGLATAASRTTNPLLLLLIVGVATTVVLMRRPDTPWSAGFRFYLWAGLFVLVLRVGFRLVLGGGIPGRVLFTLPEMGLPEWMAGITIGGPATVENLVGGLYDGMRLAAMLICLGAANALADAKRLLRSVPRALHDLGAAVVVAVGFAPQLVESVRRVHRAQRLRGHAGGGRRVIRRTLMPVLEDATARALVLAAAMEGRGYGHDTVVPGRRRLTGALILTGLVGVAVGLYGLMDGTAPVMLGFPVLMAGVTAAAIGFVTAGSGVTATSYRPDPWRAAEWAVAGGGIVAAAGVIAAGVLDPEVLFPSLSMWPALTALGATAVLTAAIPVWVDPGGERTRHLRPVGVEEPVGR
ncbi:MAG: energy-coupling factor transporter transmembrane protein EcfT [Acidimicrobiia bacterium]|nr:energy-coupling factor transporter transmembrane protein EcfT [Acidimicrobiia bacterium]